MRVTTSFARTTVDPVEDVVRLASTPSVSLDVALITAPSQAVEGAHLALTCHAFLSRSEDVRA